MARSSMDRALKEVFKSELQAFDDIKTKSSKIFENLQSLVEASRICATHGEAQFVLGCRYDDYPDLRTAYITLYIGDVKSAGVKTGVQKPWSLEKVLAHKPQLSLFFFRDKETGVARVETRCFDRVKGRREEIAAVLDIRNLPDFSVDQMNRHIALWLSRNFDLESYKSLLRCNKSQAKLQPL